MKYLSGAGDLVRKGYDQTRAGISRVWGSPPQYVTDPASDVKPLLYDEGAKPVAGGLGNMVLGTGAAVTTVVGSTVYMTGRGVAGGAGLAMRGGSAVKREGQRAVNNPKRGLAYVLAGAAIGALATAYICTRPDGEISDIVDGTPTPIATSTQAPASPTATLVPYPTATGVPSPSPTPSATPDATVTVSPTAAQTATPEGTVEPPITSIDFAIANVEMPGTSYQNRIAFRGNVSAQTDFTGPLSGTYNFYHVADGQETLLRALSSGEFPASGKLFSPILTGVNVPATGLQLFKVEFAPNLEGIVGGFDPNTMNNVAFVEEYVEAGNAPYAPPATPGPIPTPTGTATSTPGASPTAPATAIPTVTSTAPAGTVTPAPTSGLPIAPTETAPESTAVKPTAPPEE